MSNYWSSVLQHRIGRRRAIVATGTTAAAAAFLAACGGSSDSGSSADANADKSGLVTALKDTTKEAKRGGVKKYYIGADVNQGFDVHVGSSAMEAVQVPSMGTLLIDKPGYMKGKDFSQEGDVMESWEFSPDKLTLTMKLRQNNKFAPIAPVNGRTVDMQDVLFSWDRYVRISPSRGDMANSVNPAAPVISMTAPDANTLVIKLKQPSSFMLSLFSGHNSGKLQIFPKEADTGYDPKTKLIGSGPYYMADYKPSIGFTLKRNPGFNHSNDVGFIDTIEMPIISEYSQALAQLKAGNIYTYQSNYANQVRAEDIIAFKKDVPEIAMYQSALISSGFRTFFGQNPKGQSPWRDERVRQAYSMALDRDLFIETVNNVSAFTKQGLPVDSAYNNALSAQGWGDWWLDPMSKTMGDNSKYFKRDIAEAKKLMAAAGHANGFETISTIIQGNEYGTSYPTQVEIIEGMVSEIGIRHKKNVVDYTKVFQFQYRDVFGAFEGLAYKLGPQASAPEPTGQLVYDYHSKASTGWYGFDASGKGDNAAGDPAVDALLDKATAEFDAAKRKDIVYEIQKYLGKPQYGIRWPGGATGFLLAWPALQNFNVYQQDPRRESVREWIDDTKAPLKRA